MNTAAARPTIASRLYGGLALVAAAIALSAWFAPYPLDRRVAAALLAAYGLLVVVRPASWLVLLPALWPVVDLTAWTGHIHFTESDALALTTVAALGLREAFAPPQPTLAGRAPLKLTVTAVALFGLLAASVAVSGLRGLLPLPPLDAAALVGYNSSLNALRVGKGFVLAFALIPFLHLAVRRDGDAALDRLASGLTLGLGSCALAALWERLAFTDLTDFATDYRTTALFWEMHVGGAALDAWLTLSFPFALLAMQRARSLAGKGLALAVVGLGSYALFTTFSRIAYAALFVALAVLGALALRRPAPAAGAGIPHRKAGVLVALAVAVLAGGVPTFHEGGYRALLAFTGLALLAWPAGSALAGIGGGRFTLGLLGGVALAGLSLAAALALPKAVYVGYAISWLATALVLLARLRGLRVPGAAVVALLAWMAAGTVLIGAWWSEPTRFGGTAVAAAGLLAIVARQACGRTPLWSPRGQDFYGLVTLLAAGGMVVTTLGGFYMGSRLAATGDDLDIRFEHVWRSLGLVHGGSETLFGLGLGRYPEAYFWNVDKPGVPGSLTLLRDDGGRFMRLGGPKGIRPSAEVLTFGQRIPTATATPLRYRFRVRTARDVQLDLSVCRKNLLYPDKCTSVAIPVRAGAGWQTVEGVTPEAVPGPGRPPRPAVFAVTTLAPYVDLDDFELRDAEQQTLLANGDFERGIDFWFFSADRDHLPFHAKNLFVHTFVEQGLLGLAALLSLLAAAMLRLLRSPTRLQAHAPTLLAALAGVTTVGMVDSLVDIPRITVFVILLLWLALNLRRAPAG